jgi:hypothetical protein
MNLPYKRSRLIQSLAAALLSLVVLASGALAYNPPVDTAGPLSVRIEGPAEVTQTDVPQAVRVLLENKGDAPLQGTVELGLVDRWHAEPGKPVSFSVGAKGSTAVAFTVVAGKGTYSNVHYPIHAYARFSQNGQALVAHPILILQTKLPAVPKPAPTVEWKSFKMVPTGQLALWQLPVHRTVFEVFGQPAQTMPAGWQGSDPKCGASMQLTRQALDGQVRSVLGIHPPWKGGAGTLLVEYPIELPKTSRLRLVFAQGQIPEGDSDGLTFRVRVAPWDAPAGQFGKIVFERHAVAKRWLPGEADLSAYAGQTVRLQLESHPGPKKNTSWDHSYWAEPTLVAGTPAKPAPFPKDDTGSRVLGSFQRGTSSYEIRLWPGQRGLLDAVVGFAANGRRVYFRGFQARVAGIQLEDLRAPILLDEAKEEPVEGGYQVRHRFHGLLGSFDLVIRLTVESGVLRAKMQLENGPAAQPWHVVYLEDAAVGSWSLPVSQVYAGHGNVVRDPKPYRLAFEGHRLATSFVGFDFAEGPSLVQAVDIPADALEVGPQDRHYSLHTPHSPTYTFIPAENVWEGARVWHDVNGLKAAGGVKKAAGRFVFDLWGGRYAESATQLQRAFRYGLTDAMVVWHNWQRWGYDYRLPNICPPNPDLGTLDEMKQLIQTCKQAGTLFAPHDNYIDFYPDADGFSYEKNIAFHRNGQPVKAWDNSWRGAQSYRYRSDRIAPYLQPNVHWIRENLAPTGFFIDVWSSIGTYDYWTVDGKFVDRVFTRNTWGEMFAWIRETLGDDSPQISESGHDQLIGWLDGGQTNHLRIGKPGPGKLGWTVINWECADAERTPWLDAAHHDRFVLHGAGYPSRYEGGLNPQQHGIFSDDYIATEVLTGHPAMVSTAFSRDVVRKYWLLHDVMRALALKQIEAVEFADGDLHRQHVRWEGGGEVWVNRGPSDWQVEGVTLPEYGFLARVPTDKGKVLATIARRDGVIVETVRSPEQLYVNGRQVVGGAEAIEPTVQKFEPLGGRQFKLTLRWQADSPIPAGWCPFIHFCDDDGEIVFQGNQQPGIFEKPQQGTLDFPIVCTVPGEIPAGRKLELRVGLYRREGGARLSLSGQDDGTRRIRLGQIQLEGSGNQVNQITWAKLPPHIDPYLARQNPQAKPIDFGPITTSGACRLTAKDNALVLTPLPNNGKTKFDVRLRWELLPWTLAKPVAVEAVAEDGSVLGRQAVRSENGVITLTCEPKAFCYRFVGQ